ncbi:flavin reductase family protein [Bacillus horti]|uniref:Flavin reductase (DIM6/NTAB) family NADH-FMN oxidoreductase RutF n=1 Tax=Caldalkalibacillus horti TaxID=77523 RepID=A0ABT9W348_9BACI|nr:flavin reductase family protein [Bacillus horti]MDQ0167666.1 flavin reductase (DIM6/NTAB) family NADH-FMN oxidoreductase RutF [Bacillus horti]
MRQPIDLPRSYSYPGMVAIVTSNSDGIHNIMASGWHTYVGSSPAIYGISLRKETFSYELIQKSGMFGVNFLPANRSEWIQSVGTFSGREMNKFEQLGIEYEAGLKVDVPILKDAYFAYECKVTDILTHGDHEWITGEVLQTYMDIDMFTESGIPDFTKLHIPLYLGRSTYSILDHEVKQAFHPLRLK